ncbi:biotin carboxylase N-terminal domain-containing protein [Streptacidiphilus sp. P02-A3a]|uniref:acetyl/propionyl/methylcrotonyl-CoA carboxylase subunit alpha n=1 Tax=Streptacidiphilus sp. P02-A3a TaxID=2704468 RepID=UPI0015F83EA7|nr:biotin carboxylase N-terminal domain-containing protein [Streptacidiphilus sp. P02-A3a]QMU67993.1 acetyl/propionyl-CoA carboxylase subunit alpha [Streptacidiphilus sp. P02-A3a]
MFDSVLVANRGEIAVRVTRTLRRLGVRSVAVHSGADADAPHVRAADTAVLLGPADGESAADSYLHIERILEAAARTGAQAVHPGYGFLAENAAFARACADAGLVFIGPPPSSIELMGDKIHAKAAVQAAGVPVVPGSEGDALTDAELLAAAADIGLPVLLKPSAGGGGKGMRLVRDAARLGDEIAAARREARASFGDDTLLLERWVDRPRHIEIQLLADTHGGVVHLGERECSLQRRHQKLIEEAPSPLLTPEIRAAMGQAAVRAAESCGYAGAGTVEFIVPSDNPSSYFFMEMNTRLQVEHPVTELTATVHGSRLDLVEQQLRIAAGEPLGFGQRDIGSTGHAVEARVCAEDPERGFLPTGGRVLLLEEPTGEGVRVDSGLARGVTVGSSYDPMLSKVIAYGPDRATALRRLRAALAGTCSLGVATNAGYLRRLLAHPDVVAGRLDTGLVERNLELTVADPTDHAPGDDRAPLEGAAHSTPAGRLDPVFTAAALARQLDLSPTPGDDGWTDPFSLPSAWRTGGEPAWTLHRLRLPGGEPIEARVRPTSPRTVLDTTDNATAAGEHFEVRLGADTPFTVRVAVRPHRISVSRDGLTRTFAHATDNRAADSPVHWLGRDGDSWPVQVHEPLDDLALGPAGARGAGLNAPMPGTVTVVKATVGERVAKGQPLLILEAMKMEHVITAPHDGIVEQLRAVPGGTVAMDELLAVVTPHEEVS